MVTCSGIGATLRMVSGLTRRVPTTSTESTCAPGPAPWACAWADRRDGTAHAAAAQAAATIIRRMPVRLRLRARERTELQPLAVAGRVDLDLVALGEVADQDLLGERVLDIALDGPLERPGAEVLVVAVLDQEIARRIGQLERELFVGEPAGQLLQHDPDDLRDVFARERVEYDHAGQPVQEI